MTHTASISREQARARLLAFLDTIRHPEVALDGIDESRSLVAAGLIDSLALLEIVGFLESEFAIDLAGAGVDPTRLSTIPGILDVIEQHAG
jgi:acyl carrier protein